MSIRFFFLSLAVSGAVSGLLLAQPPVRGPRGAMRQLPSPERQQQRFEQRLAENLSLSAEQQNKVHTTLTDSRVQSNGLNEKMQALHASLTAAMKSGDEAQIDKLSQEIASLHQQQMSIHSKTIARIYSSLTPDQKTAVGDHLEMLSGRDFGAGLSPHFGAPQRRRPVQ